MNNTVVLRLCGLVAFGLLLGGCVKVEPDNGAAHGDTNITDVTSIAHMEDPAATSPVVVEEEGAGSDPVPLADGAQPAEPELKGPLELDMSLPMEAEEQYLFSDRQDAPNFFRSQQPKPTVKWKGKLYMIDEPSPEKRMDNVDGGEISVVVPFK